MTTPTTITIPMAVAADVLSLARAAAAFESLRRQANGITRIVGEALHIEIDLGSEVAPSEVTELHMDTHRVAPDLLLFELLEAVALASGRQFPTTADRTGLEHALAALAEMSPALGATEAGAALGVIRETLREPPLSYQMVLNTGLDLGTVDAHSFPIMGNDLHSPDGTRFHVDHVTEHIGAPTATVRVSEYAP